jgi:hypothetical protein
MKKINENLFKNSHGEIISQSKIELSSGSELYEIAKLLIPIYGENWGWHSISLIKRINLSRVFYFYELYKKIINVPGCIMEFGVHFGANLSLLINLRGIFEPYNSSRKIIGFDTFSGFSSVDSSFDGALSEENDVKTIDNYKNVLEKILYLQEQNSPLNHIKRFALIEGDVCETVGKYLDDNRHQLISLAIFDMDIYRPTKIALEKILPRLTRGSILVFDQLNSKEYPGETLAFQEVLGANNFKIYKDPNLSYTSYLIYGEK